MRYIASWVFQLLMVLALILTAKARGRKCQWNVDKTKSRLGWGVSIVAIVQIAQFVKEATQDQGLGILYHIQWIGVYWIALAVYRRKYMRESASNPNLTAEPPNAGH